MKNLLIYISPTDSFNNPRPDLTSNDAGPLAKVQIENSLALGWKKEDILIYTNFDFEYGEIKTNNIKGVEFFQRKPQASKINTIIKLFEDGVIKKNELYWFHDFDAFQLQPISEKEIDLGEDNLALTDYGGVKFAGTDRWSTGSIFFKSGSKDIFDQIKKVMYEKMIDEEEALGLLTIDNESIRKRVKKINNSYNFIGYHIKSCYKNAIKPLKVAHFHPLTGNKRLGAENSLRFFKGENPINTPLITNRLIKILKYHRIRDDRIPTQQPTVAIITPTYKRAHKILSVYKNAKESSPLINEVYFVVEKEDQESIEILKSHQIPFFFNERVKNVAGALNTGYSKTSEKYIYTGSDDFNYKPGWLEKCLEKMVGQVKVVGINDLHNSDILNGTYATSFLIDRDYIKESSGTFDAEGLILSESYLHNYSDREFVEIAKLRGVYIHCLEAVVEHLHWSYGLSPKDETYTKQNGTRKHDLSLFLKRRSLWTEKVKKEQHK